MKLICLEIEAKKETESHSCAKMVFVELAEWPKKEDCYTTLFENVYKSQSMELHTAQGYNTKYGKQRRVLLILKHRHGTHSRQPAAMVPLQCLRPLGRLSSHSFEVSLKPQLSHNISEAAVFWPGSFELCSVFLQPSLLMAFLRMTYGDDDWWPVTSVMETGSPVHQVTTINVSQPSVGQITDAFRELSDLVLSFPIHGDEFIERLWLCMNRVTEINGH